MNVLDACYDKEAAAHAKNTANAAQMAAFERWATWDKDCAYRRITRRA
jgi:hypothetical protein